MDADQSAISRAPIPACRRTSTRPRPRDIDRNGKRGVIYTIAPSPLRAPMVWIGTDDGLIQLTTDDGKTWQNVTPPAITPWSRVTMIEASHFDVERRVRDASIAISSQDFEPYIYRTRDMGKTWQKITTRSARAASTCTS